jgi:hypothetical protein
MQDRGLDPQKECAGHEQPAQEKWAGLKPIAQAPDEEYAAQQEQDEGDAAGGVRTGVGHDGHDIRT